MNRSLRRVRACLLPVVLVCAGLPAPGAAEATCAAVMASMRVEAPPADLDIPPGSATYADCTAAELAMFNANRAALREASVVDPRALVGTWLSDDVIGSVVGALVAGQEVLRVAPGETPGTLFVTQFWMKAVAPEGAGPLWSDDAAYRGIVAEGTLSDRGNGRYEAASDGAIVYSGRSFEASRSYDLLIMLYLNHFEWGVTLGRAGDVLVLEGTFRNPQSGADERKTLTYTRVADEAPELAMMAVVGLAIPQVRLFDCLTHQFSDGRGPLFEALSPMEPAQVVALVRENFRIDLEREMVLRRIEARGAPTAADRAALMAVTERARALYEAGALRRLDAVMRDAERSGCAMFR